MDGPSRTDGGQIVNAEMDSGWININTDAPTAQGQTMDSDYLTLDAIWSKRSNRDCRDSE